MPKLRFFSSLRSTIGSGWFHSQNAKKTSDDDRQRGGELDLAGAEPVLLLALVEREFEQADADRYSGQAGEVDRVAALHAGFDLRWVFDHLVGEVERNQANGDVDEEDPVPVVVVGDPAAEGGADGGRDDDSHAVDGEGLAAFFDGEGVGENGLFAGREAAAAEALQDAGDDQEPEAGREAAERRADGEHDDADHVEAFAADAVRKPAGDGQNDGGGDEVAGQHPGGLVLRCADRARDMRQGDVGDGGVEHLHERGERNRQGNQPGVMLRFPHGFQDLIRHISLLILEYQEADMIQSTGGGHETR